VGPVWLLGRGWESWGERGKEAWDFGAVGEVGCALLLGEVSLFRGDEAELQQADGQDGEDGSGGRHEECQSECMDEGAEVEGIAQTAVGSGGDDAIGVQGGVFDDGDAEVG